MPISMCARGDEKRVARGIRDNKRAYFGDERATCSRARFNEQVADTARRTTTSHDGRTAGRWHCDITRINIGRATGRVNAFPDQRSGRVLPPPVIRPPCHFVPSYRNSDGGFAAR